MSLDCREAERKLEELIEKENLDNDDVCTGIRSLALIMLMMKRDMRWIRLLLLIILTGIIGIGGMQLL